MIMQKKIITALLFLSIHAVSYSMDPFFHDEQQKKIDLATHALLYAHHQIKTVSKKLKRQDEVSTNSNGNYRTVRKIGRITSVELVQKEPIILQAKL